MNEGESKVYIEAQKKFPKAIQEYESLTWMWIEFNNLNIHLATLLKNKHKLEPTEIQNIEHCKVLHKTMLSEIKKAG